MSTQDEIKKAVGAHGMWKARLRAAITNGTAVPTPAQAAVDNACDFGRWLYALPAAQTRDAHFATVKDLHARFHAEAANVLRLVDAGKSAEATKAIGNGSPFDQVSTKLTNTLMDWSKAA